MRPLPRVLAAVPREAEPRILSVLPQCNVRFVHTGEELLRALDEGPCHMVIVGMQFDESTAAAALERIFARDETFSVVCVRGMQSRLGKPALDSARIALGELGAQHFIDLLEYPDDEAGNGQVRSILGALMRA
jgi:hypothetical protein